MDLKKKIEAPAMRGLTLTKPINFDIKDPLFSKEYSTLLK